MAAATTSTNCDFEFGCCSSWPTVQAYKKSHDGSYIIDPDTGKNRIYSFSHDVRTDELYNGDFYQDDTRAVTVLKCVVLAVINPFYTIGCMGWHFGTSAVAGVKWAISFIKDIKHHAESEGTKSAAGTFFKGFFWHLPQKLATHLWKIVRVPIYTLGMEFMFLYGLVNPYEGRKWAARIEKKLHYDISWKKDYRMFNTLESGGCTGCIQANLEDIRSAEVFYLAFCFQPKFHISSNKLTLLNP
jgi:hypothetical protein